MQQSLEIEEHTDGLPELWENLLTKYHLLQRDYAIQGEQLQKTQALLDLEKTNSFYLDDAISLVLITLDETGIIQTINRAGSKLLGSSHYRPNKTIIRHFIHPRDEHHFQAYWKRVITEKSPQIGRFQLRINETQPAPVQVECLVVDPTNNEGLRIKMIITDLTEHYRFIEERFNHQNEMTKYTQQNLAHELASNITHEIREPLTAIIGYTNACINKLANPNDKAEIIKSLTNILDQAKRANSVTSRLNHFIHKSEFNKPSHNTNELIRQVILDLDTKITTKEIELVLDLDPTAPDTTMDRYSFSLILLSLLINIIDALPYAVGQSFVVSIKTSQPSLSELSIEILCNLSIALNRSTHSILPLSRMLTEAYGGQLSNLSDGTQTRYTLILPT